MASEHSDESATRVAHTDSSNHDDKDRHSSDLPRTSSEEMNFRNGQVVLTGKLSPGVARIEAINAHLTQRDRIFLGVGVFIMAYAYQLDSSVRFTYQSTALSDIGHHSLISTINVVRAVIAAAAQPTAAKVADVFGRVELIFVSILFYVVGTIVEAVATNVSGFAAGAVLYQVGFTVITLLVEVIVADISSLRSRLAWSFISATPLIINTWISGSVAQAVLATTTWRWGIGMFCIIYPVCSIPLLATLISAGRRATKSGTLANYQSPCQQHGLIKTLGSLFWQVDVVGIILMIAMFALILVPFTIAGGESATWGTAHVITPLVIGICVIPIFIFWERRAPHPLVPFHLLKDRSVWGAIGIAWMLNFVWYMQGDYLYTVLIVGFDQTTTSATRLGQLYSFVSVLTGVGLSLIVRFGVPYPKVKPGFRVGLLSVPYLKPFIVFGTVLFMVAFGILIYFRGGNKSNAVAGVIGAQCVLGFAGGLFSYPTQTIIQSATQHEHLAIITAIYLATYNIGSAFGATVSGALWTQILPQTLNRNLAGVTSNVTVSTYAYSGPLQFVFDYPVGTPERDAVITSYRHIQRLLCITGICLCILLITFALCLRNPRLGKEQSLPDAERMGDEHVSEEGITGQTEQPKKKGLLHRLF